jgi:hypothetical protein
MDIVVFLFLWCATAVALFASPFWYDRVAVIIVRCSGLGPALYPTAVGIAMSIYNHPEQWSSDGYTMSHPEIGSIYIGLHAWALEVTTEMGKWKPNFIERRIIREAVDWRIGRYIRDRLEVVVRKNALR